VSDKWHYAEGEKSVGPLNLNEMQEVFSKVSDPRNLLVWKVGFKDWKRAEDVQELAELICNPPPLPKLRRDQLRRGARHVADQADHDRAGSAAAVPGNPRRSHLSAARSFWPPPNKHELPLGNKLLKACIY
jgi:hypothetical protein